MMRPRIGICPAFFHEDPERNAYKNMKLLYVDESVNRWLQNAGAFPILLPLPDARFPLNDILGSIDGLLLQGGPDICPENYREIPIEAPRKKSNWGSDEQRDRLEREAVQACLDLDIPVLGLCRGVQSINVALGGTLYQDIEKQNPGAFAHRRSDIYEKNVHAIEIVAGSRLQSLYAGLRTAQVNSIHHQAIKEPGKDLEIEARSVEDGIIEAVRLRSDNRYVAGVQWHPEWMNGGGNGLLDTRPLVEDFLKAVTDRRTRA